MWGYLGLKWSYLKVDANSRRLEIGREFKVQLGLVLSVHDGLQNSQIKQHIATAREIASVFYLYN